LALEKAGAVLESALVTTSLSTAELEQQYSSVIVVCSEDLDVKGMTEACKPLVPGGKVFVMQPAAKVRPSRHGEAAPDALNFSTREHVSMCRRPVSGLSSCVALLRCRLKRWTFVGMRLLCCKGSNPK
jgi:hypothetical protein